MIATTEVRDAAKHLAVHRTALLHFHGNEQKNKNPQ